MLKFGVKKRHLCASRQAIAADKHLAKMQSFRNVLEELRSLGDHTRLLCAAFADGNEAAATAEINQLRLRIQNVIRLGPGVAKNIATAARCV